MMYSATGFGRNVETISIENSVNVLLSGSASAALTFGFGVWGLCGVVRARFGEFAVSGAAGGRFFGVHVCGEFGFDLVDSQGFDLVAAGEPSVLCLEDVVFDVGELVALPALEVYVFVVGLELEVLADMVRDVDVAGGVQVDCPLHPEVGDGPGGSGPTSSRSCRR